MRAQYLKTHSYTKFLHLPIWKEDFAASLKGKITFSFLVMEKCHCKSSKLWLMRAKFVCEHGPLKYIDKIYEPQPQEVCLYALRSRQ